MVHLRLLISFQARLGLLSDAKTVFSTVACSLRSERERDGDARTLEIRNRAKELNALARLSKIKTRRLVSKPDFNRFQIQKGRYRLPIPQISTKWKGAGK